MLGTTVLFFEIYYTYVFSFFFQIISFLSVLRGYCTLDVRNLFSPFYQDFYAQQGVRISDAGVFDRLMVANEFSLLHDTHRKFIVSYAPIDCFFISFILWEMNRCGNCYWDEERYCRDRFNWKTNQVVRNWRRNQLSVRNFSAILPLLLLPLVKSTSSCVFHAIYTVIAIIDSRSIKNLHHFGSDNER